MKLTTPLYITLAVACMLVETAQVDAAEVATPKPVLLAQGPATQPVQAVAVTSTAKTVGARGAERAARQGPEALRRYVERTRMVYALDYSDFVRE